MTPLQMAMVAATVANGGVVMKPYVVERIVAPERLDGRARRSRDELGRAIKPADRAASSTTMMGGRHGRHRHRGADPGHPGRRQDRHRRDRASTASTRPGSSASRPPTTRRSRSRSSSRTSGRLRRHRRGSDRQGGHAGAPAGRGRTTTESTRMAVSDTLIGTRLRRALPASCASSARAGWRTSTSPRTRSSAGASRSRSSTTATRATSSSSSASAARRRTRPASRTRTSSRSTTAARPRAPTTSRWSTSTGRTLKELITAARPDADRRSRSTTRARSSRRSASRTATGSSTATSSRTTCSSTRDGRVKVTDFGIARSGASQMTEAGSIIGTAQYLSPEQARGAHGRPALRPLLGRRSSSTRCSPARCRSPATRRSRSR